MPKQRERSATWQGRGNGGAELFARRSDDPTSSDEGYDLLPGEGDEESGEEDDVIEDDDLEEDEDFEADEDEDGEDEDDGKEDQVRDDEEET